MAPHMEYINQHATRFRPDCSTHENSIFYITYTSSASTERITTFHHQRLPKKIIYFTTYRFDQKSIMEDITETMRGRTSFADLPAELTGMVLEHLISEIHIDHPRDLQRWTRRDPTISQTSPTTVARPYLYHNDPILYPGQRLNSKVKVTLTARVRDECHWQTGNITVLVPRRWNELLHSGISRDIDLAFFGRNMDVEVTCIKKTYTSSRVRQCDNRTEAAVRELLARLTEIRAYDLRLRNIHLSSENLACYLPRLRRVEVFHDQGILPWIRSDFGLDVLTVLGMDLRALHIIPENEVQDISSADFLPTGLMETLDLRNFDLDVLATLDPQRAMSPRRIEEAIRRTGWRGRTIHHVIFLCVAERFQGWLNARIALVHVVLELDWRHGWVVNSVFISPEDMTGIDIWSSFLHFDL